MSVPAPGQPGEPVAPKEVDWSDVSPVISPGRTAAPPQPPLGVADLAEELEPPPHLRGRGSVAIAVDVMLMVVLLAGIVLGSYYFFAFDTTVPTWEGRVHNIGLMHQRTIGIIVGIACVGIPGLLLVLRSRSGPAA